ncbi:MAG: hypothetical protein JWL81_991, partial [Verrucomicrobiales bacterium]|nr:hypothetical protein [Verrucomicrobiales bacterium]
MPAISLPCPTCRTPLILDAENAGQEVLCPGCQTRLRLPAKIASDAIPEILSPSPSSGSSMESKSPPSSTSSPVPQPADSAAPKTALPQGRSKTVEEERQRLAGAAAAAGAAHAFRPDEAALPADHHRTNLPTRRASETPESPEIAPPVKTGPVGTPAALPPRRNSPTPAADTAADPAGKKLPSRPLTPIEPKPDLDLGSSLLTGPSRFVRQPAADASPKKPSFPSSPVPAPTPNPASEPDAVADSEESSGSESTDSTTKRGFRLGAQRNLHFSPAHTVDGEKDTAAWGSQAESEKDAARSRRFVSLALLFFLLVAGGSGIYIFRHAFQAAPPSPTAGIADEIQSASLRSAEDVMKNVEDAKKVLTAFLAADSVESLAAYVRHPDVTRPRMDRHYGSNPIKPRKIRSESQSWSELRIGDKEFIRGAMELDDFRVYTATLELVPGTDPKIDWESF